jgi:outer membrane protein assembly factor BamB
MNLRGPRRLLATILTTALTGAALLVAAPSALATFNDVPDATAMTNGTVYAIIQSGNTIYIGGKFTSVRDCPPGTSCPGGTVAAGGVAALDATTGRAIKTFNPAVSGGSATVYALALLNGKLYVGGSFNAVDGTPRQNLGVLDATTGELDLTIDHEVGRPDTADRIRGMASDASHVYVAGYFATIDGLTRKHLAAFDADGSLDTAWKPRTKEAATTLDIGCDGRVIAGGRFRSASGTGTPLVSRATLAIFNPTTGAIDPWTPLPGDIPNGINARDISANCTRLFVGYGGANAIYAFDLTDSTGDVLWNLKTGGDVQTVEVFGDRVMFGGHFTQVSVLNSNDNVQRIRFAVVDLDGHDQSEWTPSFEGKFYGPWQIHANATQVWVGGQFTTVSGTPQYFLARFTDQP